MSTPPLLNVLRSGKIDRARLVTHWFDFDHILDAYDTFSRAADTGAQKFIIDVQTNHRASTFNANATF